MLSCAQPTHQCRATALAAGLLLPLLAALPARAQQAGKTPPLPDSVQAALARYRTAAAARDSCMRFPKRMGETVQPDGDLRVDPATGKQCSAAIPADVYQPIAYVVDGDLLCPSLRPSEWASYGVLGLQPNEIMRLEVSRDSAVLARVRCAVPAFGLIWITTSRPPRDPTH